MNAAVDLNVIGLPVYSGLRRALHRETLHFAFVDSSMRRGVRLLFPTATLTPRARSGISFLFLFFSGGPRGSKALLTSAAPSSVRYIGGRSLRLRTVKATVCGG